MSAYASLIDVLIIEDKVAKRPSKDGTFAQWKQARAVVRNQDGTPVTMGLFRIPRDLEDQVGLGLYSVGFTLGVVDWGDDAGRIEAQFVSFTPVDPKLVFKGPGAGAGRGTAPVEAKTA